MKKKLVKFKLQNVSRQARASNEDQEEFKSGLSSELLNKFAQGLENCGFSGLVDRLIPGLSTSSAGHISQRSISEMSALVRGYSDDEIRDFYSRPGLKNTKPAFWVAISAEYSKRML